MDWISILILLSVLILWSLCSKPVYLFYRDSCPHCVDLKPEWSHFESLCRISFISPKKIDIEDPSNIFLVEKYEVMSVPMIIKNENGQAYIYSGDRISYDIYAWANRQGD